MLENRQRTGKFVAEVDAISVPASGVPARMSALCPDVTLPGRLFCLIEVAEHGGLEHMVGLSRIVKQGSS